MQMKLDIGLIIHTVGRLERSLILLNLSQENVAIEGLLGLLIQYM